MQAAPQTSLTPGVRDDVLYAVLKWRDAKAGECRDELAARYAGNFRGTVINYRIPLLRLNVGPPFPDHSSLSDLTAPTGS